MLLIKGSASIIKLMIMICIYIIKEIQTANRKQIKRQLKRGRQGALKPVVLRLFGLGSCV
ncbi:hypothetical protein D3M96_09530 [Alcaligenes aquatilis]|uniref:Uncharacterized protein n=1 Tax=Alcaligenes aquatilis TaxID=323284 RepID=A0A3G2HUN7_9BURK|nr:hypothetical protein D3M96_09530 [Alcaligenes aquatilis]